MCVNANLAGHRILFLGYVSLAVLGVGPRPAGQDHLFLQIVAACIALHDRAVVLAVVVNLAARNRASGDDSNQRFSRQWPRKPFAVVTRLELLRRINPEQADELLAELNGVAIGDREAMRGPRAVDVGPGE